MTEEKWLATLSTTEPYNNIGLIKLRRNNENSEVMRVRLTKNSKLYDLTTLKVFFVTHFTGKDSLNVPVQKEATIINAKEGLFEFTLDEDCMQKVGRQEAYFEIYDYDKFLDATQNFTYEIIQSSRQMKADFTPYIETWEEAEKMLNEGTAKNLNDRVEHLKLVKVDKIDMENKLVDKTDNEDFVKMSEDLQKQIENTQIGLIDEYDNIAQLNTAYPKGAKGFALVTIDGIVCRFVWNGNVWENRGPYNGMGISEKSVGTKEVNFLNNNNNLNLFDGNYKTGTVRAGENGFYLEGTTNKNNKIVIEKIESNTKYYLKRSLPSRLNVATSTKEVKEGEYFDGSVKLNLSGSSKTYFPMYVEITTGPNDKFIYINTSVDGSEPYVSISKLPPLNNENYYYNQAKETVDIQGKKGFVEMYNLFSEEAEQGMSISGASPFKYIRRDNAYTFVAAIEANTEYKLIRDVPSRLNWGTSTKVLKIDEELDGSIARNDSGPGETYEPKSITFKTGPNDKFIYVNNGIDGKKPGLKLVKVFNGKTDVINHTEKKLDDSYSVWLKDFIKNHLEKIGIRKNKITCHFDGNESLKIFVPSEKNNRYVRYDYEYIDSVNSNMFQWRVLKTYVVDSNFNIIFDLDMQTEWEGAIKEKNASDFMGGTHGDERNISISILVDNKTEYDFKNGPFSIECDSLKIFNESILNRVDNKNVDLLHRFRVNEWTIDDYVVQNNYVALEDFLIEQSKTVLMSCKYEENDKVIINRGRSDLNKVVNMNASNIGDLSIKKQGIRKFEVWGPELYLSAEAIADFDKYPNNYQMIENFPEKGDSPARGKIYFDVTGEYSIKKNEQLRSKSIFKIIC